MDYASECSERKEQVGKLVIVRSVSQSSGHLMHKRVGTQGQTLLHRGHDVHTHTEGTQHTRDGKVTTRDTHAGDEHETEAHFDTQKSHRAVHC